MPSTRSDYYVYVLFDAQAIPRYVGKGSGKRIISTMKLTKRNYMKNSFIEQTRKEIGDVPFVKVRESLPEDIAFEVEIALIAAIGRRKDGTGPLTNLTAGGDGMTSEEARLLATSFSSEKRAAINRAISFAHRKYTPEERSLRATNKSLSMGPERRKAAARKGADARLSNSTPDERKAAALKASMAVRKVRWVNDGNKNRRINHGDSIQEGWTNGRIDMLPHVINMIKSSAVRTRWITDGRTTKRLKRGQSLPTGWTYGLKFSKASSIAAQ